MTKDEKQWNILSSDEEVSLSMSGSDSDVEENDKVRDSLSIQSHRQSLYHCSLEDLLSRSKETYPKAYVLLDAHLQLDIGAAGGVLKWANIQTALSAVCNPAYSTQGDIKVYTKFNIDSFIVPYYVHIWNSSTDRLKRRIADLCDQLVKTGELRQFGSSLDATNRKAFNIIVQIWRKKLRGSFPESVSLDKSLQTSLEASLLFRKSVDAVLSLCIKGCHQADLEALDTPFVSGQKAQWKTLYVCADESSDAKNLLHSILCRDNHFTHVNITTHIAEGDIQSKRCAGLSPMLLRSDSIVCVRNEIQEIQPSNTFRSIDYRQVIKVLIPRNREVNKAFKQPPRLASLSLLACAVINIERLDVSTLPRHLRENVQTVVKCTSCARYMARQITREHHDESTSRFREQAIQAGFKFRSPIVEEVIESLSHNDAYLPPLCETFELTDNATKTVSIVNIGGPQRISCQALDTEKMNWQFCSFCAALHLGFIASTQADRCRCIMCTRDHELHTNQSNTFTSQWRRIRPFRGHLQMTKGVG